MKHFYQIFRTQIQRTLKKRKGGLEATLKGSEFLKLLDGINKKQSFSRDKLIDELADGGFNKYSHGVFGCFEYAGHYLKETQGPNDEIKRYADAEKEYSILFKNREKDGPQFKSRIWVEQVNEGLKFRLIFNDRKGDHRGASHTDYTLLVPKSEASQVKSAIKSDPKILIEVFQKVFPNYDRSNGTLSMHEKKPYSEH